MLIFDYAQFSAMTRSKAKRVAGEAGRSGGGVRDRALKKPGPGRRERKKREKLERIRAAAAELFALKGFDGTTTREIAELADVATGTVFLYAADKRDLLFLVYRDRIEAALEEAFGVLPAGMPLLAQLLLVFGRLFDLYAGDPTLALHFVKEQLRGGGLHHEGTVELRQRFFEQVSGLVRDAQDRGEVAREIDPGVIARASFSLYYGALTTWLGGWATAESAMGELLRPALEVLLRGAEPRRQRLHTYRRKR